MISSRCGLSYAGAKGSSAGRAPSRGEGRERSCLLSRTFPSDCKTFLGGGFGHFSNSQMATRVGQETERQEKAVGRGREQQEPFLI